MPSFPLLPSVQVLFSASVRKQKWPSGITTGSHKLANMPSFPLLPSVQVLFFPSVRKQDWPSGITTGSHKLANYAFVSFATFCSSPLLPFCEKPGLAFRDHHWLAQTRKLCVYFLCYLLFKCRFVSPRKLFAIAACKSSCSRSAFERRSG
jgi:hypothetical protein